MSKVSIAAQIMEVDYELKMRRGVYPRRVNQGKMKQAEADLHLRQLEAVRTTLLFCRDNEAGFRDWLVEQKRKADADAPTLMPGPIDQSLEGGTIAGDPVEVAFVISALERSLAEHRHYTADLIIACSRLDRDDGEIVPRPGTLEADAAPTVTRMVTLIKQIETIVGRPVEHPEPQWFDDLLDGKWSLQ